MYTQVVRRKVVDEEDDDEFLQQPRKDEKSRQKTVEHNGEDISLPPPEKGVRQDVDW